MVKIIRYQNLVVKKLYPYQENKPNVFSKLSLYQLFRTQFIFIIQEPKH